MANMFNEDGTYNKTEWKAGDKITAVKLNKIESSLEAINNNDIDRHIEADDRLDVLEETIENSATKNELKNLENTIKDNSDNIDLELYKINTKMSTLENDLDTKMSTLENDLDIRISTLEKMIEYYLTDDVTLNELISMMPETGGVVVIPSGRFYINEDVYLNKSITLKGFGDESVLIMNNSIISDTNPLHPLYLKDFKVITRSSNPAFILDKRITGTVHEGYPTLNSDLIIENLKFFTESAEGTFIKITQLCNSSIINTVFQCKFINTANYNALDIESIVKLGIRNLSIENCKFVGLNYAIKVIGDKEWYTHTCGLMINDTLIMDCNYGLYTENLDWVTFENGMIDYTDHPVKTINTSNLKIKNNYIFSRRREISSACVEYCVEDTKHCMTPEIVGNHMWNSSYGNLSEGVITTGVLLKVKSNSQESELIGGVISKNTIHRVNRCVSLVAEECDGFPANIKYCNIEGNNLYMANRGIYSSGNIQSTIAPNNTFNTIVKAMESQSTIPLSNTLVKVVMVDIQGGRYGQVASGIPKEHIQSIHMIYSDDVFTFGANAFLKENSDVIAVITTTEVPSEKARSFKVEVRYTPSW